VITRERFPDEALSVQQPNGCFAHKAPCTENDVGRGLQQARHGSEAGEGGKLPKRRRRHRLTALQLDDVEDLWEFHLGGETRVWGIRRGAVCYLLWWDPGHEVWPSTKKGT
jgi:hypothetical protein